MNDPGKAETGKGAAFTFTHVSQLLEQPPPLEWLVQDYLLPDTLALLFGEPAAGKSLLALHWAVDIALSGKPVLIIAGEGHFGLKRRLKAQAIHRACEDELSKAPLMISDTGTAFLDKERIEQVADALDKAITTYGSLALIIVDTLHRNLGPGDENSSKDMATFVEVADTFRLGTGATILIVHHSGHANQSRARGSSSLLAAVDTALRLEVAGEERILEVTKMKDAPTPEPQGYLLKQMDLPWIAENGTPETSVILELSDSPVLPKPKRRTKETKNQKDGLSSLTTAIENCGQPATWPSDNAEYSPDRVVHVEDWRTSFYETNAGKTTEAKRKAFQRARKELADMGLVGERDDYCWREPIDRVTQRMKL